MSVDPGDLIIEDFEDEDPYANLTQADVDAAYLALGARPPGWPTLDDD